MSDFIGPTAPDYWASIGNNNNNVISYTDEPGKSGSNFWGNFFGNNGAGGVFAGVGDLVCSIRGNCQPKQVVYSNNTQGNNMFMWIILAAVIIGLIFILKK